MFRDKSALLAEFLQMFFYQEVATISNSLNEAVCNAVTFLKGGDAHFRLTGRKCLDRLAG